jgi:hypothetical protein
VKRNGDNVTVGGDYSSTNVTTSFWSRELGLYADDPDEGEILFGYRNTGEYAEHIPEQGGANVITKSVDFTTAISGSINVTAVIDPLNKIDTSQVFDEISGLDLAQILTKKADLDGDGKLPVGQLPSVVTTGGLAYQGVFDASTGLDGDEDALPTPEAGNFGWYWICDVGGTYQGVTYNPKDWILIRQLSFTSADAY